MVWQKRKRGCWSSPPLPIVKRQFDYGNVRYRGLRKNLAKLEILFTLADHVLAKREVLGTTAHAGEKGKRPQTTRSAHKQPKHPGSL